MNINMKKTLTSHLKFLNIIFNHWIRLQWTEHKHLFNSSSGLEDKGRATDVPREENSPLAGSMEQLAGCVRLEGGLRDRPGERSPLAGNRLPPAVGILNAGLVPSGQHSTASSLSVHLNLDRGIYSESVLEEYTKTKYTQKGFLIAFTYPYPLSLFSVCL